MKLTPQSMLLSWSFPSFSREVIRIGRWRRCILLSWTPTSSYGCSYHIDNIGISVSHPGALAKQHKNSKLARRPWTPDHLLSDLVQFSKLSPFPDVQNKGDRMIFEMPSNSKISLINWNDSTVGFLGLQVLKNRKHLSIIQFYNELTQIVDPMSQFLWFFR